MKPAWEARRRWRGCTSKIRYAHEGQVRRVAHELGQNAYKCRYCPGFHTTRKAVEPHQQPWVDQKAGFPKKEGA